MSSKLVEEVVLYAPNDLTPAERLVLMVIAHMSQDSDRSTSGRLIRARTCFPSPKELARRTSVTPATLPRVLQRLAARGLEVRVQIGEDKAGRPLYAVPGRATIYRLPDLAGGTQVHPADVARGTSIQDRVDEHPGQGGRASSPKRNEQEATGREGGARAFAASVVHGDRPHPRQCLRHQNGPNDEPCRPCGRAREEYEQTEAQHERAEAVRRQAELDTLKCSHGVVKGGEPYTSDGTRRCLDCDLAARMAGAQAPASTQAPPPPRSRPTAAAAVTALSGHRVADTSAVTA